MTTNITELVYNTVLASGKAKNIAEILSINYATLMREINIYDPQAKLGLKTFLHIADILNDINVFISIAELFQITIIPNEKRTYSATSIDEGINAILRNLFIKIREYPDKQHLSKSIQKSYVRLLKEVNVHDPSAKLGIDTFIDITYFLYDLESIIAFLSLSGYLIVSQKHELNSTN